MKRIASFTLIIALSVFCLTLMAGNIYAADKLLDAEITSATTSIDKNGNEYVRLIVPEQRKINGVEYEVGVAVMAFGSLVEQAKTFQAGDALSCVASSREYQGTKSYTIVAFR